MMVILTRIKYAHLAALSLAVMITTATRVKGEDAIPDRPQSVTTADINVPIDQLEFLVKPLTKEELVIEADAWFQLLKAKVADISAVEIAVRQQNKQIATVGQAAEAMEKAKQAEEDAQTTRDEKATKGAQAAAKQAEKKAEVAMKATEAAKVAEEKAKQNEAAAEKVVEAMTETVEEAPKAQDTPAEAPVPEVPTVYSSDMEDPNKLKEAAEAAKAVAGTKAELKIRLLDRLTTLRAQRTAKGHIR